jgi:hypothetical protein
MQRCKEMRKFYFEGGVRRHYGFVAVLYVR